MNPVPAYRIEPMTLADLDEVVALEQVCFSAPWPRRAFQSDLDHSYARYVVLRAADSPAVLGYAGLWLIIDEAHITTIAVHPNYRCRGLGELLLLHLIDLAAGVGVQYLTLEVRAGNQAAQGLYRKYGFTRRGTRKGYYSDTGEDALIMWGPNLAAPATQRLIQAHRQALWDRLNGPGPREENREK
jgi:ribosomal-protein-alanine N-acetyltransferase